MEQMSAPQIEIMRVAGVPQEVIRMVAGAETVTAAERQDLTDRQIRLIDEAQAHVEAVRAAAASGAATARVNSIVVVGFCAVTGLLSLLLLTRKTVRLCEECRSHD
jgi:dienelactone hydrolase